MIRRAALYALAAAGAGALAVTAAGAALALHEHLMLQRAAHGKARALHRIPK